MNAKEKRQEEQELQKAVSVLRAALRFLINSDLPLPQIAEAFPEYAYEQVYGTVLVDKELNPLYRKHLMLYASMKCKLDTAEWRYDKLRMHMDSVYEVYNIHNSYSRIVSYDK